MRIAIASGKGGAGKTTLSVNLALWLSRQHEVTLCDLDVEEPDAHLFISGRETDRREVAKTVPEPIADKCVSCGLCREVCAFHAITLIAGRVMVFPQLCHGCYACIELCPHGALKPVPDPLGVLTTLDADNLRFVEGRLNIGQEQAVPLIRAAQKRVESTHPALVIYDAPPGTACPMVQTAYGADYIILVNEPTPFGLHDMKLAAETLRELGKPFGVVINKDDGETNDIVRWCEESGVEILARIPHKRELAALYAAGRPLLDDPDVEAAVAKIAARLLDMREANDA